MTSEQLETLAGLREWCRQEGWLARVAALDAVLGPARAVEIWPCSCCNGDGLVGPGHDRSYCPDCIGDGRETVDDLSAATVSLNVSLRKLNDYRNVLTELPGLIRDLCWFEVTPGSAAKHLHAHARLCELFPELKETPWPVSSGRR